MNQILQTNLDTHSNKKEKYSKKFKLIFIFSILFFVLTVGFFSYRTIKINNNEKLSEKLNQNYNTLKLYSQKDPFNIPVGEAENELIGNISISKINS